MDPVTADDSDCKLPANTQDTQAVLSHPDSTTEPVVQHEIQPQRRWHRTSLEAQTDISPGHVEDPLQDVHNDASFEHSQSDQDGGPDFSPDTGGEQSSLQACCTSYTNVGKTENNQTLYVDNQLVEAEEHPSKDIYDTEGHNAKNVSHRLLDTCHHKETLATIYQCGPDVDDICMDRPDVEICEANSEAEDSDHNEIQTETVVKQLSGVENSSQNKTDSEVMTDGDCIRPYAVAYDQYGQSRTNDEQGDVFDVQPYAVAYDDDEGHYENQTSTGLVVDKGDGLHPNPMYSGNALHPNPMYSGNALHPNPVYVPNGAQPRACGGQRNGRVITTGVAVAILIFSVALITGTVMPGKQDSFTPPTWPVPTSTAKTTDQTDGSRYVDYTLPQPTSTKGKETDEVEQTTIVFGGIGHEAGKFNEQCGVVVSPNNEIFVCDMYSKRVQVFSMKGVYLRHFPTITSENECETIVPKGISIDGKGHLWVIGDCSSSRAPSGRIVRYTKTGHHITTLHPSLPNNTFFGIAVDALRSHVVVTEAWLDYSVVKVLYLNGTVVRKFRMQKGLLHAGVVAVGQSGNLFVTDYWTEVHVYVYNVTGHYLFRFGGDDERFTQVTGICTDSSDNVLVADGLGGKVELFTEDGRYVRPAASGLFSADSVAVAPGGQLVVTNDDNDTVTIFPHY